MGLTVNSVGINASVSKWSVTKNSPDDKIIAIAGNPNVGKSTVFNALTGMNQHTGNWPGKTVESAQGRCRTPVHSYMLVDIPGTYSLMAHSAEEEVARNFICFGGADAVVVVCDATCLERNMNLVLQTMEITGRVILCVNLMDEARRKHISLDLDAISSRLGIPVIGTIARKKSSLSQLTHALDALMEEQPADGTPATSPDAPAADPLPPCSPLAIPYKKEIEEAIAILEPAVRDVCGGRLPSRWLSLRLLDPDSSLLREAGLFLGKDLEKDVRIQGGLAQAKALLLRAGLSGDSLCDSVVASLAEYARGICVDCVSCGRPGIRERDLKADRILTSRLTGYPVMIALMALVFWLTITGANYPSQALSAVFFRLEEWLGQFLRWLGVSAWLQGLLVQGIFRVLGWVVSVMLPPMAIFFPLFTLLEDVGYLPRIAYNLDYRFKKCHACGKQALTMAMGFGCNAAGIVGCRIIDSPRERLIAMLTNNFVPCNGRFPTLIAIITMFFLGNGLLNASGGAGFLRSALSALFLTGIILLGIAMTFLVSRLLSATILKGVPSSFTLELPPYRRPQLGKVIVRSLLDRTIFVLGRAVAIAAPAGMVIWLMANINVSGMSLLSHCSAFLDPFARLMGLDGTILIAFILGLPANEIVVPIIIMAYLSQGSIQELNDLNALKGLLTANGWTWVTAVSTCLFSLMHWPCSTTLLTIKKETGSIKWMLLALLIPTAAGIICCMLFTGLARLIFPV